MNYRKTSSESDLLGMVRNHVSLFPPLEIEEVTTKVPWAPPSKPQLDALLIARWGAKRFEFGVEVKSLSTPKVISEAARQIQETASHFEKLPLLIVPYLNTERLAELEQRGVSGIDLCGNGVVVIPDVILIYRTGRPNWFPRVGMIKNVYRGTSSIVARLFLLAPELGSVREALDAIRSRGGELTLGTVSKVCTGLDNDLIIERKRDPDDKVSRRMLLLQPDALLEKLVGNYAALKAAPEFTGKCRLPIEELEGRLGKWEANGGRKAVRTGESSVDAYAVMAREPLESFYCTDLTGLLEELGPDVRETDRFPNVRFVETRNEAVYFDRRSRLFASPIQVYLELATGDKRQQETAIQVRRSILSHLGRPATERD